MQYFVLRVGTQDGMDSLQNRCYQDHDAGAQKVLKDGVHVCHTIAGAQNAFPMHLRAMGSHNNVFDPGAKIAQTL